MEFVKDLFGNEIRVGDTVICAHSKHAALYLGEVVSIGNTGALKVKYLIMPYDGYSKEAISRKEQIINNIKPIKEVEETKPYRTGDNNNIEWRVKVFNTKYMYCIKYPINKENIPTQYVETKDISRDNWSHNRY